MVVVLVFEGIYTQQRGSSCGKLKQLYVNCGELLNRGDFTFQDSRAEVGGLISYLLLSLCKKFADKNSS